MQGLAQFVEDVVRDVGDVVYRTLANRLQTFRQPIGRRCDLHAAHDPRRVTRTQIGIANFDRCEIARFTFWVFDFGL